MEMKSGNSIQAKRIEIREMKKNKGMTEDSRLVIYSIIINSDFPKLGSLCHFRYEKSDQFWKAIAGMCKRWKDNSGPTPIPARSGLRASPD